MGETRTRRKRQRRQPVERSGSDSSDYRIGGGLGRMGRVASIQKTNWYRVAKSLRLTQSILGFSDVFGRREIADTNFPQDFTA